MKLRRLVACSMAVAMTAGSVMGCSSGQSTETTAENTSAEAGSESASESSSASGEGVKLTMMNSKPEIEDALEEAVKDYQQKTGVEIEVYSTDKPGEVIAQKYAAGDPATLIIGDYSNIKDVAAEKLLPLNDEKWVADGGDLLGIKVDDNLYGFPLCIEAAGLIYNKTAIEEITGEEFKPEDYVTLDEFKPLLEKLKEGGMESPVILNSEDWSIGQHFLQYIYKMHTGKAEDALAFLDEVRQGKANFEDDAVFNALYDTMDVLIDNNINKADPLAADYDLNASYLAEGESAFWLNGSWAWPDTKEYVDGSMSYGIMPYPVNGDFTSAGQLNANATKFIAIDNVKATPEQQEAAKDFLNWLVYDEEGQDLIVNKCNLVPAFSNIKLDMTNDFNKSVKKYVDEGKVNAYVPIPSDHRSTLAAYMQKYLAGELDRAELAGYLDDYWKNH
ncbi:ABC transporter substrate-binding protein [Brotaphodocola sp.]|uniref:ABC transporter substrate-binding protein n=1 Tax=Brotaphodocola sp. TaxID=3073577 RepID=UPI003D7C6B8A